jgi:hypothetical protein
MTEAPRIELLGEVGYERMRALLAERGFDEGELWPHTGEAFGSWAITVSHAPRLRIVWEAKDEWVIIQGELLSIPRARGDSPWEDLWIGKRSEDLTLDAVVSALERLRDFSSESQRQAPGADPS